MKNYYLSEKGELCREKIKGVYQIPAGVREIESRCFWYEKEMEGVVIPNGLERIGRQAFWGSSIRETIELPTTIKEIGAGAFSENEYLTHVTIPGGVRKVSRFLFCGCERLETIVLEEGVEEIGDFAFEGTNNLLHLFLPKSIKKINSRAFPKRREFYIFYAGNKEEWDRVMFSDQREKSKNKYVIVYNEFNLPKMPKNNNRAVDTNVVERAIIDGVLKRQDRNSPKLVPAGTIRLEDEFYYATDLAEIILPKGLKEIGDACFAGYMGKTIVLPESVEKIGACAFECCQNLKEVTIPSGVRVLETCIFNNCRKLKRLNLQEGLEEIGMWVIKNTSIKEITLPNSLKTMRYLSLGGCKNLKTIVYKGTNKNIINSLKLKRQYSNLELILND
ncbi:MAG: leucine-rich repeat domain-containing protein [Clostridia bacterium]|nr:leucine-rich repeat domain-containing protein [Clostridia bacterium]